MSEVPLYYLSPLQTSSPSRREGPEGLPPPPLPPGTLSRVGIMLEISGNYVGNWLWELC